MFPIFVFLVGNMIFGQVMYHDYEELKAKCHQQDVQTVQQDDGSVTN